MKYHNHTIVKEHEDLGIDDPCLNYVYLIYNNKGVLINVALTLSSAKEFIDSGKEKPNDIKINKKTI